MNALIQKHIEAIRHLCPLYHVDTLFLFGSVNSEQFSETSDVDFLVQFTDDLLLAFADNYFEFHNRLENLLDRPVDLVTQKSIQNPYLARSINKTKQKIYERKDEKYLEEAFAKPSCHPERS